MLARLLGGRAARVLGALGAWLLAVQALGLPLVLGEPPEACCCAHKSKDQKCGCRVCTHQRQMEAGQSALQSCAPDGTPDAVPPLAPFFPPAPVAVQTRPVAPRPQQEPPRAPPDFSPDVPTPPPLDEA